MNKYPGKVVFFKDKQLRTQDGKVNDKRILKLLEDSLCRLSDLKSATDFWKMIVNPGDVVGIKVNCLSGRRLSTTPELVGAITQSLVSFGVKPEKILVWDRSNRELKAAGFTIKKRGKGPLCFGTDSAGYERRISFSGEVGSCLSRILTSFTSVLINAGVLKDHNLAGVSAGMKNLFGIIHNPNKYHDNTCDPYVADVSNFPIVRKKLRLTIVDGILAQYHNGPAYSPAFSWKLNGLLVGTDPVAVDRIACDVLEKKRKENHLPCFRSEKRWPKWLETAKKYGLGESDLSKIKLLEETYDS